MAFGKCRDIDSNIKIYFLLSRAVDNKDIMKKDEYFGAVFFSNLMKMDKTYDFINGISREFNFFGCNYDCRRKRKPSGHHSNNGRNFFRPGSIGRV